MGGKAIAVASQFLEGATKISVSILADREVTALFGSSLDKSKGTQAIHGGMLSKLQAGGGEDPRAADLVPGSFH